MASMTLDDEIVRRTRKGQRRAVEAVLTAACPSVWRMAAGLTGDAAAGRAITETVLQQSVEVMAEWRDGASPENWYYHHTLLMSRRAGSRAKTPTEEVLAAASPATDVPYHAFVRAMRKLPLQQREAFILHQGERLNPRLLGVAMDCSITAAQVHLDAAHDSLRQTSGGDFESVLTQLTRAYAQLTPPESIVFRITSKQIARRSRAGLVRRLAFAAVIAMLLLSGWHWRGRVIEWFGKLRTLDTPATRPASG